MSENVQDIRQSHELRIESHKNWKVVLIVVLIAEESLPVMKIQKDVFQVNSL